MRTTYLLFDTSRPPFDDMRVRRAFAMATDCEALVETSLADDFPAVGGFVPPGVPGHSPGIGLPYDPVQARHLLSEAGYPAGQGFPTVECQTTRTRVHLTKNLQAQWEGNLRVSVAWQAMEWQAFLRSLNEGISHLCITGWRADYPDPDNYLRARMGEVQRRGGWQNEDYDRLIERAQRSLDQGERMRLWGNAARIIAQEVPILPLFHPSDRLLVKPWITKFSGMVLGELLFKDVIIEPH
jgi:oligopeptide transport system substrate-binding protein